MNVEGKSGNAKKRVKKRIATMRKGDNRRTPTKDVSLVTKTICIKLEKIRTNRVTSRWMAVESLDNSATDV